MADFMKAALGIAIAMVLIANVIIQIAKNTNTTYACVQNASQTCSWTTTEITLWGLISLVAIMSLIYGVANAFGMF